MRLHYTTLQVLSIDPINMTARVEAGITGKALETKLAAKGSIL